MLKKSLPLLLSTTLFAANKITCCTCSTQVNNELSTTQKVAIYTALGVGTILAAPYILPASALVALSTAATSVATSTAAFIIPTTTIAQISTVLAAGQTLRPYAFQTTEEKLNDLLKERDLNPSNAKTEFISCLKRNKATSEKNAFGRPAMCEEAALFYALTASNSALDQKTEAFNNGQCFCS